MSVLRSAAPLLLSILAFASPVSAAVPDDFAQETRVSGLARPVAMVFLPDGRLLVAEQKTGQVKLLLPEDTQMAGTVLTVSGLETQNNEAGLLSLAIDPAWPQRPYLYCHYTALSPREMRLTRYTASGDLDDAQSNTLSFDSGTAVHLLTGIPDVFGNHNGGSLRFGTDGFLYFSIGDDENRCAAQVIDDFRGKVLRLDVTLVPEQGEVSLTDLVAAGNPYVGQGDIAGLVWAIGMRNPFRMALDSQTNGLFVGDVGQVTREEISHVQSGGQNLGWPYREGTTDFPEQAGCPDPPGIVLLEPIYDYGREEGASVVAGFVYRRSATATAPWPLDYEGDFFFIDFYKDYLIRLTGSGQNWSIAPVVTGQPAAGRWATGLVQAADFAIAPDGAVYYVTLGGTIQRIRYTGTIVPTEKSSFGGLRSRYR
jgi:glucose/arabinose dehydrogenase